MLKSIKLLAYVGFALLWSCSDDLADQALKDQLSQDQQLLVQQTIEEAEQLIADAKREFEQLEVTERSGSTVVVPAGSNDALADAIAAAGPNGTVILESGDHYESGTVHIPYRLTLKGQPGAVLSVDIAAPNFVDLPNVLDPAIHLQDANNARIEGLELRPAGEGGSTGILVENSRRIRIANNALYGFQQGIFLLRTNFAMLSSNYIQGLNTAGLNNGIVLVVCQA